jgi:hypothetical protein
LENQIRTLLIGEIQRNCDLALLAHKDILKYLDSMKPGDKETLDRFWLSIESFLISVANISKILWPSPPIGSELPTEVSSRREALRGLLSIDDLSPLKQKKFRNHFEHYDFRIEKYAKDYEDTTIVDSNIGPISSVVSGVNNVVMRDFDTDKFVLRFRDEEYSINQVVTAVHDLLNKAKSAQG